MVPPRRACALPPCHGRVKNRATGEEPTRVGALHANDGGAPARDFPCVTSILASGALGGSCDRVRRDVLGSKTARRHRHRPPGVRPYPHLRPRFGGQSFLSRGTAGRGPTMERARERSTNASPSPLPHHHGRPPRLSLPHLSCGRPLLHHQQVLQLSFRCRVFLIHVRLRIL